MTDLQVRLFQTHDRAIVDHVIPLVDQLAASVETEGEDPASAVLTTSTLSEEELATELYESAVLDNHACFLLETAPDPDGGPDDVIRLDAWLTVPDDLAPATLQDLVLSPTLVLVPMGQKKPKCVPLGLEGDFEPFLDPEKSNNRQKFLDAHDDHLLDEFVARQHQEIVAAVLDNCDTQAECPGVLGCWTLTTN